MDDTKMESSSAALRMGIDLGGTKIEGIVLSQDGEQLWRQRIATPQGDYQGTLKGICDLVKTAERELGQSVKVGVGTPGAVSLVTQHLKNSNSTCLNGKPIVADLEQLLQRSIVIANDANCFALSEAVDGNGRFGRVVFGVIIGTGTGGGIVVNKQVLTGPNSIAGEWGHSPMPLSSEDERRQRPCYCGRFGCVETFLSGPALERYYQHQTGNSELIKATEINELVESDARAAQCIEQYSHWLAIALGPVINLLDPDVIVLGGGLSNIESLYQRVPQLWDEYIFTDRVQTQLVPAKYGDSSGVRGAAWLQG